MQIKTEKQYDKYIKFAERLLDAITEYEEKYYPIEPSQEDIDELKEMTLKHCSICNCEREFKNNLCTKCGNVYISKPEYVSNDSREQWK